MSRRINWIDQDKRMKKQILRKIQMSLVNQENGEKRQRRERLKKARADFILDLNPKLKVSS